MSTLVIALSDILLDLKNPINLSKILPSQALSCLYIYIGFKKIDPTVNTGLDFEDAYQTAISLMREKGRQ